MSDVKKRIRTVRRAAELFRHTAGRNGSLIALDDGPEDVLVAGDLHGNLANFQTILDRARLDRNPTRHLVLQELVHGEARYPNGGCKSHQLVDLTCALKCQYPDRVHYVLGNHELAEIIGRPILKGGVRSNELFRRGIEHAYTTHAGEMVETYADLFRSIPLAVRLHNRTFVSHSYPEADDLDNGFDPAVFDATGTDCLRDHTDSMHDLVWGRDGDESTAHRFAALVDANLLITGHMPCSNGFRSPNSIQLILDSSGFPACYCLVPNRSPVSLSQLLEHVHTM